MNYDYFVNDIIEENKDMKNNLDFLDEKVKKYEIEHKNKLKRNDEITEDLKMENSILKYFDINFI